MLRRFQFAVVLLAVLALMSGCKRKKPPIPQPQEQAPTITTQPLPPQPEPLPPPQPQPPASTPANGSATVTKPKPKARKKPSATAKKTTPAPDTGKKVIRNGSTGDSAGQLSAGMSQDEALHQRQTTAQLLASTDYTLRAITRTLTADEQAMVQQIRSYMQQSRSADSDGDTERAYNLALKAHLLSDELAKR